MTTAYIKEDRSQEQIRNAEQQQLKLKKEELQSKLSNIAVRLCGLIRKTSNFLIIRIKMQLLRTHLRHNYFDVSSVVKLVDFSGT
jgi:hypothetical protein